MFALIRLLRRGAVPLSLSPWETFYVITGGAGAALTGLTFVVIALAADQTEVRSPDGFGAFSTPTLTHFASALLIAAVMTIPVQTALSLTICLGVCAATGLLLSADAGVRMRRMTGYAPDRGDWMWHVIVPGICYAVLLAAAGLVAPWFALAEVGVAAVVMALLAIGIHNAWDVAVYLAVMSLPESSTAAAEGAAVSKGEPPAGVPPSSAMSAAAPPPDADARPSAPAGGASATEPV